MKRLISLIALLAFFVAVKAATEFSYTYNGNTVTYTVLSGNKVTTKEGSSNSAGGNSTNKLSGILEIPETVKSSGGSIYTVVQIGKYSFANEEKVTKVIIPKTVTEIGYEAFWKCGMTEIELNEGLETIRTAAFQNCKSLKEVTLPESVINFGLRDYKISNCLNGHVFNNCIALEKVVLKGTFKSIGQNSFGCCWNLKELTIPETVNEFEQYAFGSGSDSGCKSLKSLTYLAEKPAQFTSYSPGAIPADVNLYLKNDEAIEYVIQNQITPWCNFVNIQKVAPPVANPFTSIEFQNSEAIKMLVGTDETMTVSVEAPEDCDDELTWAVSDSSVGTLTVSADNPYQATFHALKPGTVTVTAKNVGGAIAPTRQITVLSDEFTVDNIHYVIIPGTNTVKTKGGTNINASSGEHSGLKGAINIPNNVHYDAINKDYTVVEIGCSSFTGNSITSIELPASLEKIGPNAFRACQQLTSINIPEKITELGDNVFNNCIKLTTVELPEGLEVMGNKCFYSCKALTSISLPSTLKSIGESAFADCVALVRVDIPDGVTTIGKSLFSMMNSSALKEVSIGEGVTEIPDQAFYYCINLETVKLPQSVTSIGSQAFLCDYKLKEIEIPDNVTSIGASAFSSCPLETITYLADEPCASTKNIFKDDVYTNATLYLASDKAIETAKVTEPWKYFFDDANPEKVQAVKPNIVVKDGIEYILKKENGKYVAYVNGLAEGNTETQISIPTEISDDDVTYTVTKINENAFIGNTTLESIEMPTTLTSIGADAFSGCSAISSINIPASVISIAQTAFDGCTGISEVIYDTTDPKSYEVVFPETVTDNAKLVVSPTAEAKIKENNIKPWINFANIYSYVTDIDFGGRIVTDAHHPFGVGPDPDKFVGGNDNTELSISFTAPDGAPVNFKPEDYVQKRSEVLTIGQLKSGSEFQLWGKAPGTIKVIITAKDYKEFYRTATLVIRQPKLGDSYVDTTIDGLDIINTVSTVTESSPIDIDYFDKKAADANNDNRWNVADVTKTAQLLLEEKAAKEETDLNKIAAKNNDELSLLTLTEADGDILIGIDALQGIVTFQADVTVSDPNAKMHAVTGSGAADHALMSKDFESEDESAMRILLFSFSNEAMSANPEAIAKLTVETENDVEVVLTNIEACDANGNKYRLSDTSLSLSATNGVNSIDAAAGNVSVYTTNGVCVMENVANDELKNLEPGVYVVIEGDKSRKLIIK